MTLTLPIRLWLIDSRVAHAILIHPIPSFHAYPVKLVLLFINLTPEKSTHPAWSFQPYPDKSQVNPLLFWRSTSYNVTHPTVWSQKDPVRVCPTSRAPVESTSVGSAPKLILPGFPSSLKNVPHECGVPPIPASLRILSLKISAEKSVPMMPPITRTILNPIRCLKDRSFFINLIHYICFLGFIEPFFDFLLYIFSYFILKYLLFFRSKFW